MIFHYKKIFFFRKNFIFAFIVNLFFVPNILALDESILFNKKQNLLKWRSLNSHQRNIISVDGKKIFYRIFFGTNIKKTSDKGQGKSDALLFVLPGMTEPEIKYTEFIYDLRLKFSGTIIAVDHRGQGQSDRDIEDLQKTFVFNFNSYISDFEKIVNIEKKLYKDLYLVGHSMGAHIAFKYMLKYPKRFSKAILVSPMFEMEIGMPWVLIDIYKFIMRPELSDYLPGRGSFKKTLSDDKKKQSVVTSSISRINLERFYLMSDPKIQKGGPTLGWLLEAKKSNLDLRASLKTIETPIIILQAENDKMVKSEAQNIVCKKQINCRLINVKQSKHEILMEQDAIRNQALSEIYNFMNL